MNEYVKVTLRGEDYRLSDRFGELWLLKIGGDGRNLRYPDEVTAAEKAIISAEWEKVVVEERQRNDLANAKYEAQAKREAEELERGAVRIRYLVWHVEQDHIWRATGQPDNPIQRLNFSELNAEEIEALLKAREREVKNRGIGGFFRRIGRKLDAR